MLYINHFCLKQIPKKPPLTINAIFLKMSQKLTKTFIMILNQKRPFSFHDL